LLGPLRGIEPERDQAPDSLAFRREAPFEAIIGDRLCLIFAKGEEPLYWELGAVVMHIQDMLEFHREIQNI
jgi:hypothetical protein